jgi:cytochrome c
MAMVRQWWMGLIGGGLLVLTAGCGIGGAPAAKPNTRSNTAVAALNNHANRHRAKKVTNGIVGVPRGALAATGAAVFRRSCASCHGTEGRGTGAAPRLMAPSGVVSSYHSESALYTFIRDNMPANRPGSLAPAQYRAVAAYVWQLAGGK